MVAEVNVKLIIDQEEFSPCMSLDDADKFDDVREVLEQGNIKSASKLARVFKKAAGGSVVIKPCVDL